MAPLEARGQAEKVRGPAFARKKGAGKDGAFGKGGTQGYHTKEGVGVPCLGAQGGDEHYKFSTNDQSWALNHNSQSSTKRVTS